MVEKSPVKEFGGGVAPFGLAHRKKFLAEFIEVEISLCGFGVYL